MITKRLSKVRAEGTHTPSQVTKTICEGPLVANKTSVAALAGYWSTEDTRYTSDLPALSSTVM